MFIFGNVILGIAKVLNVLLDIYFWVIVVRALISWVNPDPNNPIVQFLQKATEPVLRPLRKIAPPWRLGGLDISPLIAILIIYFLQYALIRNLIQLGQGMR